jgi:hypothetical protein
MILPPPDQNRLKVKGKRLKAKGQREKVKKRGQGSKGSREKDSNQSADGSWQKRQAKGERIKAQGNCNYE